MSHAGRSVNAPQVFAILSSEGHYATLITLYQIKKENMTMLIQSYKAGSCGNISKCFSMYYSLVLTFSTKSSEVLHKEHIENRGDEKP